MRRRTQCIVIILIMLAVSVNAQKVKDGFKGFEWGTSLEKLDSLFELNHVDNEEAFDVYNTNINNLGDVKLDFCHFYFYKKQFMGVWIKVDGYSNYGLLLKMMDNVYGDHEQENQYIEKYTWHSKKTLRILDYNKIKKETEIRLISISIYRQQQKDEEEKAKKGADDF